MRSERILVHVSSGIGDIVLATPLLLVLSRHFSVIDLRLDADYPGAGELFRHWSALRRVHDARAGERPGYDYDIMIPAVPPFAWRRFESLYRNRSGVVQRPPDALFYHDSQTWYLEFARRIGCDIETRPGSFLPAVPAHDRGIGPTTLALAPGCKTGEMAAKRWPHFPRLAEAFADVVLVGTPDDLRSEDGQIVRFPSHIRSLIGELSLRELADVLAACGAVVANDSGIGHMAAAVGTPVVLLFGPTPHETLGVPPNATVLRAGLGCEPCWFSARLAACGGQISCLATLPVSAVIDAVARYITPRGAMSTDSTHAP